MVPAVLAQLQRLSRLRDVIWRSGERGQGMVEYGLILILIAMVVLLILQFFGHQVNNTFSNISNGLSN